VPCSRDGPDEDCAACTVIQMFRRELSTGQWSGDVNHIVGVTRLEFSILLSHDLESLTHHYLFSHHALVQPSQCSLEHCVSCALIRGGGLVSHRRSALARAHVPRHARRYKIVSAMGCIHMAQCMVTAMKFHVTNCTSAA
jgi:hypothetical protein